jgi:hypothetical protein
LTTFPGRLSAAGGDHEHGIAGRGSMHGQQRHEASLARIQCAMSKPIDEVLQ